MAGPSAKTLFTFGFLIFIPSMVYGPGSLQIWCPKRASATTNVGENFTSSVILIPNGAIAINGFGTLVADINCTRSDGSAIDLTTSNAYPFGKNTITCTASEVPYPPVSCNFDVSVKDKEAPRVFDCPSSQQLYTDPGSNSTTVDWVPPTFSDNVRATLEASHTPPFVLEASTIFVSYSATDQSGRTDVDDCQFTVNVTDNEAPNITYCPDAMINGTDVGSSKATVSFIEPAFVDNVGFLVDASHQPGDQLDLGTTTVIYNATDGENLQAMCSFNVTIEDREPPTFDNCVAVISLPTEPSRNYALFVLDVQAQDNVGVVSLKDTGLANTFPVGDAPINVTAIDAAGNEANCDFNITVYDNEAPDLYCNNGMFVLPMGDAFLTFNVMGTLLDNVSPMAYIQATFLCTSSLAEDPVNITIGTSLGPGDRTLNCTGEDEAGNMGSCLFEYNVTDDENPMMDCFITVSVDIELGQSAVVFNVTDLVQNITDNAVDSTTLRERIVCMPFMTISVTVFNSSTVFPPGGLMIMCSVTDDSGNNAQCISFLIVNDVEAPNITCPDNQVVQASGATAVVWSENVFAFDVVSGNLTDTAECIDNNGLKTYSGNVFQTGTTLVNCTVSDSAGVATCRFNVTVIDVVPPSLFCQDVSIDLQSDMKNATVNFGIMASDEDGSVMVVCDAVNGTVFSFGDYIVNCNATDEAANTASCNFTVSINDVEPPTIDNCPVNVKSQTAETYYSVSWVPPNATDNCDSPSQINVTSTHNPGDNFTAAQVVDVVYTFTDTSNNNASCSFTVTIVDIGPPVFITCPKTVEFVLPPGRDMVLVNYATPIVQDNSLEVIVPDSMPNLDLPILLPYGQFPVEYNASDEAGSSALCTILIIVDDNEAPVITNCPESVYNLTTELGFNTSNYIWMKPTATDNVAVLSFDSTGDDNNGSLPIGNNTIRYVALDYAGNMAICKFELHVQDLEPPVIVFCPNDTTVSTDPGNDTARVNLPPATFKDNDGIQYMNSNITGSAFYLGITVVTTTAVDASGNEANCTVLITVEDNEVPAIMNCPADIVNTTASRQDDSAVYWPEPLLTDNVGIVVNINSHSSGDVFPVGNTTVNYTLVDAAGNTNACTFLVSVKDKEKPTVSGCLRQVVNNTDPGMSTSVIYWLVPVFTDNVRVVDIQFTHEPGEVFDLGNTPVMYTASDKAENIVTCEFNVIVKDVEAPVITGCVDVTIETDPGLATSTKPWMFPEATDNVNVTMTNTTHQLGDMFPLGVTEVTYIVHDAAGFNATCKLDVLVEDNEMPNITSCPMDVTVNASNSEPSAVYTFLTPPCTDNTEDVTVTISKFDNDIYPIGYTPVIIACLDRAGNIDRCSFTVTVQDVTPPQLMGCPSNQQAFADPGMNVTVNWTPPSVIDNSGSVNVTSNYNTGDAFMNGTHVVMYIAEDAAGNVVGCNFTITVYPSDYQSPMVVTCPNDTVIPADLNSNCTIVTWPSPVIMGNVGVTSLSELSLSHPNNSLFCIGSVTVYYKVHYRAVCNFTVTVEDTQAPVLVNCSDDIVAFTDPNSNGTYLTINQPVVIENDLYVLEQQPYPGHLYTVGNTLVLFSVLDRSGLNDSCEFTVTVVDNIPPYFDTCPSNEDIPTGPGVANAIVVWRVLSAIDNVGVVSVDVTGMRGTIVDLGQMLEVVYIAYDAAGLNATCRFNFMVVDQEDPVIVGCPRLVTAKATENASDAQVFWTPPTVSDNSGVVTLTVTRSPGAVFDIGTTRNTYVALDVAGNTDICMFDIIVQDVQDPVIHMCPQDIYRFTYPNTNISVVWSTPMAQDNSGTVTLTSNYNPGDEFYNGTYTVVYTAMDEAGNTANCSFLVQINSTDTEPPMIYCPADITIPADNGSNSTIVSWPPPPYMDNNRVVFVNVTRQNNSLFIIGSEVVVYTAYDVLSNNDSCNFTVIVLDDEAPMIVNCPGDTNSTTDPGQPFGMISWIVPMISDNSGSFNLDLSHPNGSAFPVGVTEVTYRVTDNSSNWAMCSFNVTITDEEKPIFNCPSDFTNVTLPGQHVGTFSIPLMVMDNVNVTLLNFTHQPGDGLVLGMTTVEYYAQDVAGNEASCRFTITIQDDEKPQIFNCTSDVYANTSQGSNMAVVMWPQPTAMDNSGLVTLTDDIPQDNVFEIGDIVVTYGAFDNARNVETCETTVHVRDFEDPMVMCPRNVEAFADNGTLIPLNWTMPIANDNSGIFTVNSSRPQNSDFPIGTSDITITVTDSSGNTVNCTFSIIVFSTDQEQPIIICPPDVTGITDLGTNSTNVTWLVPEYQDNEEVIVVEVDYRNGSKFYLGNKVVTYFIADRVGNNASCSFNVTVLDDEAPIFVYCPSDVLRMSNESRVYGWPPPIVTDNSGSFVNITSNYPLGFEFPYGETVVVLTAIDESGNMATCNFTVTAEEEDALMIACPADVVKPTDPGTNSTVVMWPLPMYNSSMMAQLMSSQIVNSSFEVGQTLVTYTLTGRDGKNTSCDFSVIVTDDERPVLTSCSTPVAGNTSPGLPTGTTFWSTPTATDNVGVINLTSNYRPNQPLPIGPTNVIYTAVDEAGNAANCSFVVNIQDNEDPLFTFCPLSMEFNTDENGAVIVPIIGMPNVTDNAGPPMIMTDYNLTRLQVGSSTIVTYTAIDNSGNEAACTFNITIIDATPPVISDCPVDMIIPTDVGLTTALANWAEPTPTDNNAVVTFDSNIDLQTPLMLGTIEVTYVATDAEGLTAQCKFNVTVEDQEYPVILNCPLNSVGTNSPGAGTGRVFWIEPSAQDNVGVVSLTSNYKPYDVFSVGTTEVVYEAIDAAGNVERCRFNTIISDIEQPVFTFCPVSFEIPTGANGSYVNPTWALPNATDNAGPLIVTNDYSGLPIMIGVVTTITYTAVDTFNNMDTCSFNLTVTDGTPPEIMGCPGDLNVFNTRGLATGRAYWTPPTANDNVGVVDFTSDFNSGDMFDIGSTEVTYVATDERGLTAVCQFNITVEDTEAPVLMNCPVSLVGSTIPGRPNTTVSWVNPTASDNSLSDMILGSNYSPSDTFPIGQTIVVFTATDPSGNSVNCSFTVTVSDFEVPVFTFCPSHLTLNLENVGDLSVVPSWDTPVATDNAGPPTVTTDYMGGPFAVNTTTVVTYTAVDSSSNPAECSFSVTIADAVAPKIANCPVSFVVNTTEGTNTGMASWTAPTASDDQQLVGFVASHTSPQTLPIGDLVINYTATDNQGFVTICEFRITVQDAEDPVLSGCPLTTIATLSLGAATANPFWIPPTATDNVNVESLQSNANPSDPLPAGSNRITYTASDAAGNTATCSFNVVVFDNEAPVFTFCPQSLDFPTLSNGSYVVPSWPAPNATDNTGKTNITSDYDGQPLGLGSTTLIVYTVEDDSANIDTCSFNVTIIDGTPPAILNCPDSFTVSSDRSQSSGQANWTEPTAQDNVQVVSFVSVWNSGDFFLLGVTLVTYVATDLSGFTSECSFNVTVRDTIKPVITGCPDDIAVNATEARVIDWTLPTATDNVAVVNESSTNQPNETFALGSQTIVIYGFEDEAGNFEECSFVVTIYNATNQEDLPPMIVSCPSDQIVPTEPGRYNASVTWSVPTATDKESNPSVVGTLNPDDVFSVSNTSVTYTATDSKGNTDTCVFFVTVRDEESPVLIDCPSRINVVKPPSESMIIQSWTPPTATDNSGVVTLSANIEPGSMFSAGETDVIYTAVDEAGNIESCNFTVNVTGDAAPFFVSCPSNILTNTTTNQAFATVTWVVPVAQDDVSTPILIEVNGYNPGRQFTMGTWTVQYLATDSSQQTAMCEFNITVIDRQDPVIEGCSVDISRVTLNNDAVTISWNPPVATDNSGEYTLMANDNHKPGEMLGVGMYDVIYTVRDLSGNTATCKFTIVIENDAPPEFILCPPSSTVPTDPGQNYATVSFSFPTPSDDRSQPSLIGSHAPGHQFSIGDTTVTYTAYDSAGQSAECIFVITVEDRGDPVIMNCPSDQTVYILSTNDVAAVYWTPPLANDTSSFTLSSNKNPGDTFESGSTQVKYTAIDSSDNTDDCTFSVLVLETIPTYTTDGSVDLVSIAFMPKPFTVADIQSKQDILRDDLDRLFRRSSVSSYFVGILLTSTSIGFDNQAIIEFLISFTGTPPPIDAQILGAFYATLVPVTMEFEDGNKVSPGTFMLSLSSCQMIPCDNGGSCVPKGNSYICMCTSFYMGTYCEKDVNECLLDTNPCPVGRVCVNIVGSYLCACPPNFYLVGDVCLSTSQFRGSFALTRIRSSDATFTSDLEDETSEQYQRIAGDVTSVLDGIFSDENTFIASSIIGMSSGSIVVRYVLAFSENTNMTEDMVTKQMSNSVSADGEIANSALYIRPSSLSYLNHICPLGFCKNGGTCSPDPVNYESTCTCESLYSGNRCQITDVWSPLVIAMVTVAAMLLVVLVGLFITCCRFLRKRLDEEPKYPGTRDIEQRRMFKMPRPLLKYQSSAVDPPRNPRGRSISTSFASHTNAGSGIYRHNDDSSDMGSSSYENQAFYMPYLQEEQTTNQRDLASQLHQEQLEMQRVGYANDVVPDYPQSSTFMRPYVATGREAMEHYNTRPSERRLADNYF